MHLNNQPGKSREPKDWEAYNGTQDTQDAPQAKPESRVDMTMTQDR